MTLDCTLHLNVWLIRDRSSASERVDDGKSDFFYLKVSVRFRLLIFFRIKVLVASRFSVLFFNSGSGSDFFQSLVHDCDDVFCLFGWGEVIRKSAMNRIHIWILRARILIEDYYWMKHLKFKETRVFLEML